jgi:hypothetical protein
VVRALFWFGLAVAASTALLPDPDGTGFGAAVAAVRSAPLATKAVIASVAVCSAVDAVRLARRPVSGPRCADCGKELDADIDFCPWCSHRDLDGD